MVHPHSPRCFLRIAALAIGTAALLIAQSLRAAPEGDAGPLIAYVGTFSSPLRDVLPTQVDLPPGNGRGIHVFRVDRTTGAMTAAGVYESGTSPSCLVINAAGTRLYSTNETDRAGESKEGSVSAFSIDRADGKLKLLNTVGSGGIDIFYPVRSRSSTIASPDLRAMYAVICCEVSHVIKHRVLIITNISIEENIVFPAYVQI